MLVERTGKQGVKLVIVGAVRSCHDKIRITSAPPRALHGVRQVQALYPFVDVSAEVRQLWGTCIVGVCSHATCCITRHLKGWFARKLKLSEAHLSGVKHVRAD